MVRISPKKMMSQIRNWLKPTIGLLLFLVIASCANKFQDLEAYYFAGKYPESIVSAIEGMRSKDLQPKIKDFMKVNGKALVFKAVYDGKVLMKRTRSDDSIRYFQNLLPLFEELALMDFDLTTLETAIRDVESLLETTIVTYVAEHYRLGKHAFEKNFYRKSASHMRRVEAYLPNYKDTSKIIKDAEKLSQRRISISPFFKPADPLSQLISNTLTGLLTGNQSTTIIKSDLVIKGINIPSHFTRTLLTSLDKQKSEFLRFSIDSENQDISHAHYYIEGMIDATETRVDKSQVRESHSDILNYSYASNGSIQWASHSFEYDIYKQSYEVVISIHADLFLKDSHEKVETISFEKRSIKTIAFAGPPIYVPENAIEKRFSNHYIKQTRGSEEIDKKRLIRNTLLLTANAFSQKLLRIIDRDMDPYLIAKDSL
ncbi:MAG: hypothetical protein ACI9BD_001222 [Candidatus Marinamargulisbacteria bacterium]|jgi:hypothetical protein